MSMPESLDDFKDMIVVFEYKEDSPPSSLDGYEFVETELAAREYSKRDDLVSLGMIPAEALIIEGGGSDFSVRFDKEKLPEDKSEFTEMKNERRFESEG